MILVDIIIHNEKISEDDNILAEPKLELPRDKI